MELHLINPTLGFDRVVKMFRKFGKKGSTGANVASQLAVEVRNPAIPPKSSAGELMMRGFRREGQIRPYPTG